MKNLHCPAYITALIHFHCCPEPIRDSLVNREATMQFLKAGLIEPSGEPEELRYTTTPLGMAYIASLCLVPPPTRTFQDAAGNSFDDSGTLIKPNREN